MIFKYLLRLTHEEELENREIYMNDFDKILEAYKKLLDYCVNSLLGHTKLELIRISDNKILQSFVKDW